MTLESAAKAEAARRMQMRRRRWMKRQRMRRQRRRQRQLRRSISRAYVGSFLKDCQRKVAQSGLMVALSLVDGMLAVFVVFAPNIFLVIWLGKQMLETSGEFAILVQIRCQEGEGIFSAFRKRSACKRALPPIESECRTNIRDCWRRPLSRSLAQSYRRPRDRIQMYHRR